MHPLTHCVGDINDNGKGTSEFEDEVNNFNDNSRNIANTHTTKVIEWATKNLLFDDVGSSRNYRKSMKLQDAH